MVNVIGLGYIGLPTAIILAKNGIEVVGTDYNKKLVEDLTEGILSFEEKGLKEAFEVSVQKGIKFSTEYQDADIYIVAVPTPYIKENKKLDPKYVISAVNSIISICKKGSIIIIESTISPGAIDKYIRPEIEKKGMKIGEDIHLAHAPERIIPGNMIFELENNSRTIGADKNEVGEIVKSIYSSFCKGEIVLTDIRTAEMSKVIENTYRDINIAFANELAKICREDNLNVYEVIKIANKHPRVNILQPGPGVGGHCISVDPWFLVGDYPDLTNMILTARKTNDSMPDFVLKRIRDIMKEKDIKDISKVGIYGLAYKENVDDVRESPTLQLLEKMNNHLAFGMKTYDPFLKEIILENQCLDFDEFCTGLDFIVVMVAHSHIRDNYFKISKKIILDTRNIFELQENIYKL